MSDVATSPEPVQPPAAEPGTAIETVDLSVFYGDKEAVKRVSIAIPEATSPAL